MSFSEGFHIDTNKEAIEKHTNHADLKKTTSHMPELSVNLRFDRDGDIMNDHSDFSFRGRDDAGRKVRQNCPFSKFD